MHLMHPKAERLHLPLFLGCTSTASKKICIRSSVRCVLFIFVPFPNFRLRRDALSGTIRKRRKKNMNARISMRGSPCFMQNVFFYIFFLIFWSFDYFLEKFHISFSCNFLTNVDICISDIFQWFRCFLFMIINFLCDWWLESLSWKSEKDSRHGKPEGRIIMCTH